MMKLLAFSSYLALVSANPTQEQKKLRLRGSATELEFPKPRALLGNSNPGNAEFCKWYKDQETKNGAILDSTLVLTIPDSATLDLSNFVGNGNIDGVLSMTANGILDDQVDWSGNEYDGFMKIPMYNQGNQAGTGSGSAGQIAEALIGIDNVNNIVCAAAYLLGTYLDTNNHCNGGADSCWGAGIDGAVVDAGGMCEMVHNDIDITQDGDSWLRIGGQSYNDAVKLNPSNALDFKYLELDICGSDDCSETEKFVFGWEGCWNLNDFSTLPMAVINNDVEVHFNRKCGEGDASTTSTGKYGGSAKRVCFEMGSKNGAWALSGTTATTTAATGSTTTGTTGSSAVTTDATTTGVETETCALSAAEVDIIEADMIAELKGLMNTPNPTCENYQQFSIDKGAAPETFLSGRDDLSCSAFNDKYSDTVNCDGGLASSTEAGFVAASDGCAKGDKCCTVAEFTLTSSGEDSDGTAVTDFTEACSVETTATVVFRRSASDIESDVSDFEATPSAIECHEAGNYMAMQPTISDFPGDYCDSTPVVSYALTNVTELSGDVCDPDNAEAHSIVFTISDECNAVTRLHHFTVLDSDLPTLENVPDDMATDYEQDMFPLPLNSDYGSGVTAHDECDEVRNGVTSLTFCDQVTDLDDNKGVLYERVFTATEGICARETSKTQSVETLSTCNGFVISSEFSGAAFETTVDITNENARGMGSERPYPFIKIKVNNTDANLIGDLRGVFWDLSRVPTGGGIAALSATDIDDVKVQITEMCDFHGETANDRDWHPKNGKVYDGNCDPDGKDRVAKDALMRGGGKHLTKFYTCGIEVGTSGKSADDHCGAIIDVWHEGRDIRIQNVEGGTIGVRLTSVSDSDGDLTQRERSSKINGLADCSTITAAQVTLDHSCENDMVYDHASLFDLRTR